MVSRRAELVAAACRAAAAQWSGLAVEPVRLDARLNALHPDAEVAELESLHFNDLVLATGLADADPVALAVFEQEHLAKVVRRMQRFAHSSPEDSMQELRLRLLVSRPGTEPRIAGYTGKGPLLAWVRTAAIRLGIKLSQSVARSVAREQLAWAEGMAHNDSGGDPELTELRLRCAGVLSQAYRDAAGQLDPDHRSLLYLSVGERVGIDQLANIYGIHRSTVARRIAAAKDSLRQLARTAAMARLSAGEATLNSIERLVRSQIEVSFSTLLEPQ